MTRKIIAMFLAALLVVALGAATMAASFTPSVESKPAPEVVSIKGSDGQTYAGIIRDKNGNEIAGVPDGALIVTPVSQKDSTSYEKVKERLKRAYETIQSATDLSTLCDDLTEIVQKYSSSLSVKDLVVRDLFDVSVVGTYVQYLSTDGDTLQVRFKVTADPQALVGVLFTLDGKTWQTIPEDRIIRNSDGTVDVILDAEGVVAFLYDGGKLSVSTDGVTSPQTGEPEPDYSSLAVAGATAVVTATLLGR